MDQKILVTLKIKSVHKTSLFLYLTYLKSFFNKLEIKYTITYLPTTCKRITLLKSPHVYKYAQEQFEIFLYKISIRIHCINLKALKFLNLNKPRSIKYKVIINKGK